MAKNATGKGTAKGSRKTAANAKPKAAQATPNLPAVHPPTDILRGPEWDGRDNVQSATGATATVETTNQKEENLMPENTEQTPKTSGLMATISSHVGKAADAFMRPVGSLAPEKLNEKLPQTLRDAPIGPVAVGVLLLSGALLAGGRKLFGAKKTDA